MQGLLRLARLLHQPLPLKTRLTSLLQKQLSNF
jgi:hypothetical protein